MLENSDIKLRALEPHDVDFLFDLENNSGLWHITQTLAPYSRFEIEQYVFSQNRQDIFSTQQLRLIIEDKRVNTPVGAIDLFEIDILNKRAGVGIVVGQTYKNRGYGDSALELLLEYAFNHLNLNQIFCNIEEDNLASLNLFKKHGFEISGLKKQWNIDHNGNFMGEYLLQRLR
ncbi:MAG: GNAT family N-acetyltransferase [Bacteroidales bacterium]|nr:GNAT family N-acetyltransferase [Bacteroidales bacterium]